MTGPECTGKTTLAARLADYFHARWVPEFAREYAARVARPLTVDDVEPIARGQMALEDAALNWGVGGRGSGVGDLPPRSDTRHPTPNTRSLLILDTDLISTVVYSRHYYGQCPQWIEEAARRRKADLYLLTSVDVPFMPDEVRDSAAARDILYNEFAATLAEYEATVVGIAGDWEERFAAAIQAAR